MWVRVRNKKDLMLEGDERDVRERERNEKVCVREREIKRTG